MPQSFRTHMRLWMQSINLPETMLRKLFLRRYQALLVLRGVSPHLPACRQAAMEVLLNLSRFPGQRQDSYLIAVIREIGRLTADISATMCIPDDDGTLWDVPGHVAGRPGLRFSVIEDPPFPPAAPASVFAPEIISDDE
jgi:hypothetical protein